MVCSVAYNNIAASTQQQQQQQRPNTPTFGVPDIHTGRAFDALTPAERDSYLTDIELDFRKYIGDNRPKTGFVFYPNSRQIMKALSSLYQTLTDIDFSDVFA
ncbi:hypothetical protein FBU59_006271 [Linderina macrospora]|uniref:Uncharacterized protein n=1 Tax=Linderina macrospora TaxID=4868 RepID=A0ACC1J0C2_9FUNG|nr:hypothetical protein FBU59_006271 [Linderina macrospora]